ncbi:MAG: phosphoenolpyruvate carboxykinase domain-containing protein, partial [Bacilli bacterium]
LWPGFGNNARVLKWIFERCDHKVGADLTPIGYVPRPQDIDVNGLALKPDALKKLTAVDIEAWLREVASIRTFYDSIGEKLPNELRLELSKIEQRLSHRKKHSNLSEF